MRPTLRLVVVFTSLLSAPATTIAMAAPVPAAAAAPAAAPAPTPTPAPAPAAPAAPPAAPSASPGPAPAAPAPAAPAPLTPTTTPGAPTPARSIDLTLSPSTPAIGGGTNITAKQAESLTATTAAGSDEWKFDFHGYLRTPLKISFGPPTPVQLPGGPYNDTMGLRPMGSVLPETMGNGPCTTGSMDPHPNPTSCFPPGADAPPGTQWHAPVRLPGALYTQWDFTNTVHGPWTQLNFSYGNSRAMATVIINSYAVQDGGYRHIQAQQGIDQAFITLNFPDALGDLGTLTWNIGTFQNRYGMMGKYDGGMYETYIIGRTHITGETLTADLTNIDKSGDWSVKLEHGFGGKYDLVPFLNNPFHRVFSNVPIGGNSGSPYLADRDLDYLPYAGSVPQGSTFLHHAHAWAKYQKLLTIGAHYMYTWTPDDNWHPINSRQLSSTDAVPRYLGPIQGSIGVAGFEARFAGGVYGDAYVAYSHVDARNVNALANSLELVHAYSGYAFKENFFGRTFTRHTGVYQGPQNETGTIDNIAAQYSFSFGQLARHPEEFWGDGPDLRVTVFGLLSIVDSKAPPIAVSQLATRATDWNMSTKKLKYGIDATYNMLYWLGFNARFDHVQPDLDAAYAKQGNVGGSDLNFAVLTTRVLFRTQFVTHEQIQLQYARYFLGRGTYPGPPYEWVPRADAHMVGLFASMWW